MFTCLIFSCFMISNILNSIYFWMDSGSATAIYLNTHMLFLTGQRFCNRYMWTCLYIFQRSALFLYCEPFPIDSNHKNHTRKSKLVFFCIFLLCSYFVNHFLLIPTTKTIPKISKLVFFCIFALFLYGKQFPIDSNHKNYTKNK